MVGEERNVSLPFNLWAVYKDKGCFVPRWSNSSETNGLGCQLTGMGVFSVSAASCPSKPDSQVGHLSGMDLGRTHQWGQPESNGPEQFHYQLCAGPTNSLHLLWEAVCLRSESLLIPTTYFECWALKLHFLSLVFPTLELWMKHSLIVFLKAWNGVSDSPKIPPVSFARGWKIWDWLVPEALYGMGRVSGQGRLWWVKSFHMCWLMFSQS